MNLPEQPYDLSIGDVKLNGERSIVFKGIISSESSAGTGIPPGNISVTVHDNGIRLRNDSSEVVQDINKAQLVSLTIDKQVQSFQKNKNGILRALYKVLALLTLGAMVSDLADEPSTYTREVTCLVINIRDTPSKAAQKIFISSKKRQVEKFIALFEFDET